LAAASLESVLRRDRLLIATSLAGPCLLSWLFLLHLALQMETMEGIAVWRARRWCCGARC
jgi:hypothetical protein